MKSYLDKQTRITLKFHLPALGYVLALQRKRRFGWKTISWIYPSSVKNSSNEFIRFWLLLKEQYSLSEKEIGKQIISRGFENVP